MTLEIKRLRAQAKLPERATGGSAGFDLRACIEHPEVIPAGEARAFPTGLAAAIPQGAVGLVFGRSGLGFRHGIAPSNAVGVIDSDYRGEICVSLRNHSGADYTVSPNERIAQLVLVPVLRCDICEVEELEGTLRGGGGFGSTGRE